MPRTRQARTKKTPRVLDFPQQFIINLEDCPTTDSIDNVISQIKSVMHEIKKLDIRGITTKTNNDNDNSKEVVALKTPPMFQYFLEKLFSIMSYSPCNNVLNEIYFNQHLDMNCSVLKIIESIIFLDTAPKLRWINFHESQFTTESLQYLCTMARKFVKKDQELSSPSRSEQNSNTESSTNKDIASNATPVLLTSNSNRIASSFSYWIDAPSSLSQSKRVGLVSFDVSKEIRMHVRDTQITLNDAKQLFKDCQTLSDHVNIPEPEILFVDTTSISVHAVEYLLSATAPNVIAKQNTKAIKDNKMIIKVGFISCMLFEQDGDKQSELSGKIKKYSCDQCQFYGFKLDSKETKLLSNIFDQCIDLACCENKNDKESMVFRETTLSTETMQYLIETLFAKAGKYRNKIIIERSSSLQFVGCQLFASPSKSFTPIPWMSLDINGLVKVDLQYGTSSTYPELVQTIMELFQDYPPFSTLMRKGLILCNNFVYRHSAIEGIVSAISQNLNKSKLQSLDISNTFLTNDHLKCLATTLRSNTDLKRLELSENFDITDEGVSHLLEILKQDNKTLRHLNLKGCNKVTVVLKKQLGYYLSLNQVGRANLLVANHNVSLNLLPCVLARAKYYPDAIYWVLQVLPHCLSAREH